MTVILRLKLILIFSLIKKREKNWLTNVENIFWALCNQHGCLTETNMVALLPLSFHELYVSKMNWMKHHIQRNFSYLNINGCSPSFELLWAVCKRDELNETANRKKFLLLVPLFFIKICWAPNYFSNRTFDFKIPPTKHFFFTHICLICTNKNVYQIYYSLYVF